MVRIAAEYPGSSYRYNALEEESDLVVNHSIYDALGKTKKNRCTAYRALFTEKFDEKALNIIREATNKSWVPGNDYFKTMIKNEINRPMDPRDKGGDRKSRAYHDSIK